MINILLAMLASFRLAHMIALEDGFYDVFAILREKIDPGQSTWVGRGLNCPWCVGFWTSLAMSLLIPTKSKRGKLLNWFAIAGGQVLLQKWTEQE